MSTRCITVIKILCGSYNAEILCGKEKKENSVLQLFCFYCIMNRHHRFDNRINNKLIKLTETSLFVTRRKRKEFNSVNKC